MNATDKATIPQQVMARHVGGEAVILDLASGTYYGLDAVGARIWQLMTEGCTFGHICTCMEAEYEVSPERIRADLETLVNDLSIKGLIVVAPTT